MDEEPVDPMREFVRELTEHQQALRTFVDYLMMGAPGASDVAQEVNLLLWEKRAQFKPGTNFRAWAFTMARYVALGHRRKLRRDGALVFDPDLIERLADEWEAEPDERERKLAALDHCLEQLPDEDLKLVRARYGSHGEIERLAGEIGKTSGSLRLRLFRLRAALKQCVRAELKLEGGLG
ncbi:sigma-70 family RNA polymerase sigma factor [Haloferula sp. A504]|uniref:sigma-70 family RNA polymerase sigma factor n=1 Tax=Haloferula sp. A504 TaxID=3373601 RepID=UPI0031BCAFE1|nr:sigma-70 family RNA polymerase sigma factor [Verrucomicrobiaceae bacterium E54]